MTEEKLNLRNSGNINCHLRNGYFVMVNHFVTTIVSLVRVAFMSAAKHCPEYPCSRHKPWQYTWVVKDELYTLLEYCCWWIISWLLENVVIPFVVVFCYFIFLGCGFNGESRCMFLEWRQMPNTWVRFVSKRYSKRKHIREKQN